MILFSLLSHLGEGNNSNNDPESSQRRAKDQQSATGSELKPLKSKGLAF